MAVIHPPIPVRYDFSGDKYNAAQLVYAGKALLAKLSKDMEYGGLLTGGAEVILEDGASIIVTINYGVHNVSIYSPEVGDTEEVETVELSCMCYPCMTFGVILKVYDGDSFEHYKYDVALCAGSGTISAYIDFSGIVSSGYARYEVGQYIFVGNLCGSGCLDEDGRPECMLANESADPRLTQFIVLPVHNTAGMEPIVEEIFTEIVDVFD